MTGPEVIDFLRNACLLSWDVLQIGDFSRVYESDRSVRCNHIYVGCATPFLMAATSLDLDDDDEALGITVIREPALIARFLRGPYPPYNKPSTIDLSQLVGETSISFMKEGKSVSAPLVSIEVNCLSCDIVPSATFGGRLISVNVSADESAPMGLLVSWCVSRTNFCGNSPSF